MGHYASVKVTWQLWESFLALHLNMGSGDELRSLGLCCEPLQLLCHLLDLVFTAGLRFHTELTGQLSFLEFRVRRNVTGLNL